MVGYRSCIFKGAQILTAFDNVKVRKSLLPRLCPLAPRFMSFVVVFICVLIIRVSGDTTVSSFESRKVLVPIAPVERNRWKSEIPWTPTSFSTNTQLPNNTRWGTGISLLSSIPPITDGQQPSSTESRWLSVVTRTSPPLVTAMTSKSEANNSAHGDHDHLALFRPWVATILGILAAIVSLTTVGGNILVVTAFFVDRAIRTPTNYFIASLAVTDLLIGAFSMNFYTLYVLLGYWPLSRLFCDLWLSLDYTACLTSQYTVLFITVDRFFSVKIPAKYRNWRTDRKVVVMVAVTWVVPTGIFFPIIMGWQFFYPDSDLRSANSCAAEFTRNVIFEICLTIGYFWITLIVMFSLYVGIYRVALNLQKRSDAKRRKMTSLVSMAGQTMSQIGVGLTQNSDLPANPGVLKRITQPGSNKENTVAANSTAYQKCGDAISPQGASSYFDSDDRDCELPSASTAIQRSSSKAEIAVQTPGVAIDDSGCPLVQSTVNVGGPSDLRASYREMPLPPTPNPVERTACRHTLHMRNGSTRAQPPAQLPPKPSRDTVSSRCPAETDSRDEASWSTDNQINGYYMAACAKMPNASWCPGGGGGDDNHGGRINAEGIRDILQTIQSPILLLEDDVLSPDTEDERRSAHTSVDMLTPLLPKSPALRLSSESDDAEGDIVYVAVAGDRNCPGLQHCALATGSHHPPSVVRLDGRWGNVGLVTPVSTEGNAYADVCPRGGGVPGRLSDSDYLTASIPSSNTSSSHCAAFAAKSQHGSQWKRNWCSPLPPSPSLPHEDKTAFPFDGLIERIRPDYDRAEETVQIIESPTSQPPSPIWKCRAEVEATRGLLASSSPRLQSLRDALCATRGCGAECSSPSQSDVTTTVKSQSLVSSQNGAGGGGAGYNANRPPPPSYNSCATSLLASRRATATMRLTKLSNHTGDCKASSSTSSCLREFFEFARDRREAWRKKSEPVERGRSENRARKALRTISFILGAFVLCWTPYHVVILYKGTCDRPEDCVNMHVYNISYWLCYLNSPINPFCYALANAQFKKAFLRILHGDLRRT